MVYIPRELGKNTLHVYIDIDCLRERWSTRILNQIKCCLTFGD